MFLKGSSSTGSRKRAKRGAVDLSVPWTTIWLVPLTAYLPPSRGSCCAVADTVNDRTSGKAARKYIFVIGIPLRSNGERLGAACFLNASRILENGSCSVLAYWDASKRSPPLEGGDGACLQSDPKTEHRNAGDSGRAQGYGPRVSTKQNGLSEGTRH